MIFILSAITFTTANALELPKTDKISFSSSANRQDIPSAFGLYDKEVVADYSSCTVKIPSSMSGKKADFKEANVAVSPFKNLTLLLKESKDHSEGSVRSWDTKSKEWGTSYKVYESPDNKSAISVSYKKRDIDINPIKIKANNFEETTFFYNGEWKSTGVCYSQNIDLKKTYHLSYENVKIKYFFLESLTDKFGVGYDFIPNILNNKLKIEANLIYLKNDLKNSMNTTLPKSNQMISGRIIYNIGNGFNFSIDGGMFTKGMPIGGTRFSDQGIGALVFAPDEIPDSIKKFQNEKFGYYGITLTYGVKF